MWGPLQGKCLLSIGHTSVQAAGLYGQAPLSKPTSRIHSCKIAARIRGQYPHSRQLVVRQWATCSNPRHAGIMTAAYYVRSPLRRKWGQETSRHARYVVYRPVNSGYCSPEVTSRTHMPISFRRCLGNDDAAHVCTFCWPNKRLAYLLFPLCRHCTDVLSCYLTATTA